VVFDASARSDDGWAVSRTVTIDAATGKVLSADLTATNGSSTFIFDVVSVRQISRPGSPVWTMMSFGGGYGFGSAALCLTVPKPTLVGYKGSTFGQALVPGHYASSIEIDDGYYSSTDMPLYGSLEPK
jgi:hypothetical protein